MRSIVGIVCHVVELRLPLASEPVRWLRTARWPNVATALSVAFMAGPMATERVSAANAGDNEIRIGNTMPYSGPASAYGTIGKVISAYFDKINAEGGINGRKINFISYAVFCLQKKTMKFTRRLFRNNQVLLSSPSFGRRPTWRGQHIW